MNRYKTADEARDYYAACLAAPRPDFCNYDHDALVAFWTFNAQWIDCAPDGARFLCAPMLDKSGVPLGDNRYEDVGPAKSVREIRARNGRNPFTGQPV